MPVNTFPLVLIDFGHEKEKKIKIDIFKRSAIFVDVSRNYFVHETIIQPMLNIFVKFRANILSCYLILTRLCDPP